jgi:hypothetical protein
MIAGTCQYCDEDSPTLSTVDVQTIPGSFDTKTIEFLMCPQCEEDYKDDLHQIWDITRNKKEPT